MATVTGAMTTTNILSDQLAIDVSQKIQLLEPDVQPLAVFSRAAQKERAIEAKFKWIEDVSKPRFDTTSTTATAESTTVPASHGVYFQQWDQALNTRTGEQFRIDAVEGNTLRVTRGIGSTAAAMNEGDELMIIGTAQPENDTSKPARSTIPSKVENNTQIFRTPFEVSGTARAVEYMVQPTEWERVARNAGIEHAKDIEYAFVLGRKSATTPGTTEDRTTGGVLSFITSNQTDAGGDLSEAEFNAFLAQVERYGSQSKLAMASAVGMQALNKFPASKQITKNDETTYGMAVTHYTSPFGKSLNLVWHRLLEGSKYGGYIIVVDMDQVAYKYLSNDVENRDTHLRTMIQPPDQDGRKDEFLSECGLRFGLQRTHGLLSGITS